MFVYYMYYVYCIQKNEGKNDFFLMQNQEKLKLKTFECFFSYVHGSRKIST